MSKKPKKEKPSAQDIALAGVAGAKRERYNAAFKPLEMDAINELQTASADDRAALLAGRTNADVNASRAENIVQNTGVTAASGNNFASGGYRGSKLRTELGTSAAVAAGNVDAGQDAQASIDADTLNVIKTGQDIARTSQNTLVSSARLANSRAQSKLRNAALVDTARSSALGQLAAAGVAGHYGAKGRAGAKDIHGDPRYTDDELGIYGKTLFRSG